MNGNDASEQVGRIEPTTLIASRFWSSNSQCSSTWVPRTLRAFSKQRQVTRPICTWHSNEWSLPGRCCASRRFPGRGGRSSISPTCFIDIPAWRLAHSGLPTETSVA